MAVTQTKLHVITIADMMFNPDPIEVSTGDSIVWKNDDFIDHTATARNNAFRTGKIRPGETSAPQKINEPLNLSGIEYFCEFHDFMIGRVIVQSASPAGIEVSHATASSDAHVPTSLTSTDWMTMAREVVSCWVYDMADDFEHAVANNISTNNPLDLAWKRIRAKWEEIGGGTGPITDRAQLGNLSQATLVSLGRFVRTEKQRLGAIVSRHPDPKRDVNNGQSYDPFGKAITIFSAGPEDNAAYGREARYVSQGYRIESLMDLGQSVPPAELERYRSAKAAVSVDDYRRLGAHLERGLSNYFGSATFDREKFIEGIWRMTTAGEWDQPEFVGWHWSKFIDAYLGVIQHDTVPDIIELPTT